MQPAKNNYRSIVINHNIHIATSINQLTIQAVFTSLLSGALTSGLVLLTGAAPVLLHRLHFHLLLMDWLVGRVFWEGFGHSLSVPPPGPAPARLFHVRAHGSGEGQAQARRGLLVILVGAPEVHAENVLRSAGGTIIAGVQIFHQNIFAEIF